MADDTLIQFWFSNILQVNATIIAGILILLTLSVFSERKFEIPIWGHPREIIALTVIPFCISIIFVLQASFYDVDLGNAIRMAGITTLGLCLLIGCITLITIATAINEKKQGSNSSSNTLSK